jgi:uncharacterized protein YlxW (UPF0749 family)
MIKRGALLVLVASVCAVLVAALVTGLPSATQWRSANLPAQPDSEELVVLRNKLAEAETSRQQLAAELEATRKALLEFTQSKPWYADDMILNYRNPWAGSSSGR